MSRSYAESVVTFRVEPSHPQRRCVRVVALLVMLGGAESVLSAGGAAMPKPAMPKPDTAAWFFDSCLMDSKSGLRIQAIEPGSVGPAPMTPAYVQQYVRDSGWAYDLTINQDLELWKLYENLSAEPIRRLPDSTFMDVKFHIRCTPRHGAPVEVFVDRSGVVFREGKYYRLESGRNWLKDFLTSLQLLQFPD